MITPLKKLKDGVPYTRPPEIEQALEALSKLPIEEVVRRASTTDSKDAEFVPSECVLHFVRKSKLNGDSAPYCDLFVILRKRVVGAVPVFDRRVRGLTKPGNSISETDAQELVLQKFQELLCLDRAQYEERLDFYEVRFNSALAALRVTAQRSVTRRESYLEPMQYDGDTLALSGEMEKAIAHLKTTNYTSEEDYLYRSRLLAAIKSLPPAERQVIELLLQGNTLVTIAKLLGCVEQTVRNRRNRAHATIRKMMQEEDVV
ncbi:MAG: sigma factor-like helix-turn-helix DNA-binding protein [Pirellulales bacterium]